MRLALCAFKFTVCCILPTACFLLIRMPVVAAVGCPVAVAGAARLCVTVAGTDRNRSRHAVAGADCTGRDRRTAGQGIRDGFAGHRIRRRDLDPLRIVLHIAQVNRTPNDLEVRETEKQHTVLHCDRKFGTIACNSNRR